MALKVTTHPIEDNTLRINNRETFILGATKVIVGVNTGQKEIYKDTDGINKERDKIEGQEIYNLSTQRHNPWFVLDLETGSRGWYPGKEDEDEPTDL